MTDQPYIVDATVESFPALLERSHEVPVLVDFWAEWCQPCQMLLPVLTGLAEAYAGQFVLAKVNIDQQQALAMEHGVRSVPTVKLFRDGAEVDGFLGVQSEDAVRRLLDPYLARPSDERVQAAEAALRRGEAEAAVRLLREAVAEDPDNPRLPVALAQALVAAGDGAGAEEVLRGMPIDRQHDADVERLWSQAEFLAVRAAAGPRAELERRVAADPADLDARYGLAAHLALADEPEGALEQLFEILRRDRRFRDDAGRRGMLAVFRLLGDQDERVGRYRARMFAAMH